MNRARVIAAQVTGYKDFALLVVVVYLFAGENECLPVVLGHNGPAIKYSLSVLRFVAAVAY